MLSEEKFEGLPRNFRSVSPAMGTAFGVSVGALIRRAAVLRMAHEHQMDLCRIRTSPNDYRV